MLEIREKNLFIGINLSYILEMYFMMKVFELIARIQKSS